MVHAGLPVVFIKQSWASHVQNCYLDKLYITKLMSLFLVDVVLYNKFPWVSSMNI